MSFIRRKKQEYTRKAVRGDQPVDSSAFKTAYAQIQEKLGLKQIESLYDDAVRLGMLERAERDLQKFEDLVDTALANLKIPIDAANTKMIQAASTLAGDVTTVLDGELIERALDLSMDGFLHGAGFDPVAAILGLHGETDMSDFGTVPFSMPNAPVSTAGFQDCAGMQNMEGLPSPTDSDYETKKIDEIAAEQREAQAMDILAKLWKILKYFPGLDIIKFMKKLKKTPIKKLIRKVIKWLNCNLVYPALFLMTGEAKTCTKTDKEDEPLDPDEDVMIDADDFEGTGVDCLEAAARVMEYCENNLRGNKAVRALFNAKEQRNQHEALKFGTLTNGIKNTEKYEDRIEDLYTSTKTKPRYKKRYFDHRDTFMADAAKKRFKLKSKAEYEKQKEAS